MPDEPSAMLSTRWIYTLISCSVRLMSSLLPRNNPGIFLYCRCSRTPLSRIIFLYIYSTKYFVVVHSWPAAMSAICIEHVVCEKDYPLDIRFILSCPILCRDLYLLIYGITAVCLSYQAVLSILLKECTNIQALSESPLEVCILTITRRVGTPCPWFHCFWVWVECEL